jgi:hypothetical protein
VKNYLSIIVIIVLFNISCQSDNPLIPDNASPSLIVLSGQIENWTLGDTVTLYAVNGFRDTPLGGIDTQSVHGYSWIHSTGYFSMTLTSPTIRDSLDGIRYYYIFPPEVYPNIFVSDTNAVFQLLGFHFYNHQWIRVPYRLYNASGYDTQSITSFTYEGDYKCNPRLYFTNKDVTVRSNSFTVDRDTTSIDLNLEFRKGWNKIITTLKVKSTGYYHYEVRVNNHFNGRYFIVPIH